MSILLNTMTSMLDVMDKDVQQDISRQLFERFGESLTIPTKKKAAGKRSSKVPFWIREVTEVDHSQKGFAALVGSWCKSDKVDEDSSCIYIAGIRADWYKGGGKYAIVHQGSGIEMGGFDVAGLSTQPSEMFVDFKDLMNYLK